MKQINLPIQEDMTKKVQQDNNYKKYNISFNLK